MTFIFLHLSLYIYVCTFIFIHLLLYIYIFTFTFVHLYLHIHIFTIKSITLHLYIDNCVFILASFIHSPVDIYICTFTFVYLYVYIDICTFTFIHLHCVIKNRRRSWRVQGGGRTQVCEIRTYQDSSHHTIIPSSHMCMCTFTCVYLHEYILALHL